VDQTEFLAFFDKREVVSSIISFSVKAFEGQVIVPHFTKPSAILGLTVLYCREWTWEQQCLLLG